MSNIKSKRVMDEQIKEDILDALQSELDMEVFEQEEPDVDKVKEILDKMDSCLPEKETKILSNSSKMYLRRLCNASYTFSFINSLVI